MPLAPGEVITVFGSFQGWNASDPAYALQMLDERQFFSELTFPEGSELRFRFAKGDASKVEKGPENREIPEHVHLVEGDATLSFVLARWDDQPREGASIRGDVRRTEVAEIANGRGIWIYLPPQYDEQPTRRFPVLYMLDGQNLFDASTSFAGEWRVDETVETLIASGDIEPLIVVGFENAGGRRVFEYTPSRDEVFGGEAGSGGGEEHVKLIRQQVMPFIESRYRVSTDPAETGFGGSSLGGLMSLYVALNHADRFRRIAAVSPSVWWDDRDIVARILQADRPPVRVWTDMGTQESAGAIEDFRVLVSALRDKGFVDGPDFEAREVQGARHNESAWSARLPDILRFLFPKG
ncbi:MAG: alpha/beta hydrolase [Myxococcales bacterium]|nr:alpha/beta hydrolase [Myxococcales bacterium]